MSKVYVASSWRNQFQPAIVNQLKLVGHEVYDFRNPPNNSGFGWEEIDCGWQDWDFNAYMKALETDRAKEGYAADYAGIVWCDVCLLVLPCGRSAHLELGLSVGLGKLTGILCMEDRPEPELMYRMVHFITNDPKDLDYWIR